MRITIQPKPEQSDEELSALSILNSAVYPPDEVANWPGRTIEWSPRQWSVIVWNEDKSEALAHAGIVIRHARSNEIKVKIGGIGGVMTHPAFRGQGCATAALERCIKFFQDQGDTDFGLLVCKPELIPFYERLGWRHFSGELFVEQHGKREIFTFNVPMTLPIEMQGDLSSTIDLLGPPW